MHGSWSWNWDGLIEISNFTIVVRVVKSLIKSNKGNFLEGLLLQKVTMQLAIEQILDEMLIGKFINIGSFGLVDLEQNINELTKMRMNPLFELMLR